MQGFYTAALRQGDFYFSYYIYFEDVTVSMTSLSTYGPLDYCLQTWTFMSNSIRLILLIWQTSKKNHCKTFNIDIIDKKNKKSMNHKKTYTRRSNFVYLFFTLTPM